MKFNVSHSHTNVTLTKTNTSKLSFHVSDQAAFLGVVISTNLVSGHSVRALEWTYLNDVTRCFTKVRQVGYANCANG